MPLIEKIKSHGIFKLVSAGHKPVGNFSLPMKEDFNLKPLQEEFPDLATFINPRNKTFIEVI